MAFLIKQESSILEIYKNRQIRSNKVNFIQPRNARSILQFHDNKQGVKKELNINSYPFPQDPYKQNWTDR